MEEQNDIQVFFEKLDKLASGQRVLFKRSAGLQLNEAAADTLNTFYHLLPNTVKQRNENDYFLAACVHCLWNADAQGRMPMEKALAGYASSPEASDSIRKRFVSLLDTDYNEDGYLAVKLVRIAKLLKQKGFAVDGSTLVSDLRIWNSEYRSVQKKWARAFNRSFDS